MSDLITINPAVTLQKGYTYVVEYETHAAASLNALRTVLDDEEQRLGVKFLLLPAGAKVATVSIIADDLAEE